MGVILGVFLDFLRIGPGGILFEGGPILAQVIWGGSFGLCGGENFYLLNLQNPKKICNGITCISLDYPPTHQLSSAWISSSPLQKIQLTQTGDALCHRPLAIESHQTVNQNLSAEFKIAPAVPLESMDIYAHSAIAKSKRMQRGQTE